MHPRSVLLLSHSDMVQPHSAHVASMMMMMMMIIRQNNEKRFNVHTNMRKN
jgi:hypothetical protein